MRRILMALAMTVGLFVSPSVAAHASVRPIVTSSAVRPMTPGPVVKRDTIGRAKPSGSSAQVRLLKVGTNIKVRPVKGKPKWWKVAYRGKTVYVWKGKVSLHPNARGGLWASKKYAVRYAKSIFGKQFPCIKRIVNKESSFGGRHSTNGATWGIPQALPGSKMAIDGPFWRDDPATQLRWMKRYVNGRYHGACRAWTFWQSHGYY